MSVSLMLIYDLPSDCKTKIISYLPLYDVLHYASSSRLSMENTLPDLCNRRDRLTKTIFWSDGCERVLTEERHYQSSSDGKRNAKIPPTSLDLKFGKVTELPSILDRIESLYQNLSSSHSMYESVYKLVTILKTCREHKSNVNDGNGYSRQGIPGDDNEATINAFASSSSQVEFKNVFQSFQKILQVYKLHTTILKSAIYGNVIHNFIPSGNCNNKGRHTWHRLYDNGNAVDLHLDQYLGDVHIAFLFMGNISSGLMEGISEEKWLRSIQLGDLLEQEEQYQQQNNVTKSFSIQTAGTWYQNWIFLHSTLLRTIQLSDREWNEFGVATNGNIVKQIIQNNHDHDDSNLILPPRAFQGSFKTQTILKIYKRLYNSDGLMTVIFRNFGSLGPSFRGRDSVRSHSLQLKNVIECFLTREWSMFMNNNYDYSNFRENENDDDIDGMRRNLENQRQQNERHHETIMSLALLHRESRKTRPMTCAPHTVSMENMFVLG